MVLRVGALGVTRMTVRLRVEPDPPRCHHDPRQAEGDTRTLVGEEEQRPSIRRLKKERGEHRDGIAKNDRPSFEAASEPEPSREALGASGAD